MIRKVLMRRAPILGTQDTPQEGEKLRWLAPSLLASVLALSGSLLLLRTPSSAPSRTHDLLRAGQIDALAQRAAELLRRKGCAPIEFFSEQGLVFDLVRAVNEPSRRARSLYPIEPCGHTADLRPEFRWVASHPAPTGFSVSLLHDDKVLWTTTVQEARTRLSYPPDQPPLEWGRTYAWVVADDPSHSRRTVFTVFREETWSAVQAEIRRISEALSEDPLLLRFTLASYYWSQDLPLRSLDELAHLALACGQSSALRCLMAQQYHYLGLHPDFRQLLAGPVFLGAAGGGNAPF